MSEPTKFNPGEHLMDLKGKKYMPVAARLMWLNAEVQSFEIDADFIAIDDNAATARATVSIKDPASGQVLKKATAYKTEDRKGFADFAEKASTGAVGRALGMLGFGTQFALEDFDEGASRIVDSPQQARGGQAARPSAGGARGVALPFDIDGTAKGTPISDCSDAVLRKFYDSEKRTLANPEKKGFHAKAKANMDAIRAEWDSRPQDEVAA